jgi:hypothetical protein
LRCQSSCQMICLFSSPLWMISSQELRSLSCSHDSAATCAVLQASRSCVEPATCEVPYYDYGSLLASRDEWVNLGGPGMGDPWPWLSRCAASGDRARSSKAEYAGAVQLHVWDFNQTLIWRSHGVSHRIPKSSWVSILSHGVPSFKETSICPDPDLCSM